MVHEIYKVKKENKDLHTVIDNLERDKMKIMIAKNSHKRAQPMLSYENEEPMRSMIDERELNLTGGF